MRTRILDLIAIVTLLIGASGSAHAVAGASCAPSTTTSDGCIGLVDGATCSCFSYGCSENQLGMTTMDGNKKNIVACLRDNNGNPVWKSMNGSGSAKIVGTATGRVEQNVYDYRRYTCINPTGVASCVSVPAVFKGPEDEFGVMEGGAKPVCTGGEGVVNPDTGFTSAFASYNQEIQFFKNSLGASVLTSSPPWVVMQEYRLYCLTYE